jgi:hypothetical protein
MDVIAVIAPATTSFNHASSGEKIHVFYCDKYRRYNTSPYSITDATLEYGDAANGSSRCATVAPFQP